MSLAEFEPGSLIRRQVNQPWAHCASHNANDIDNADDIDNANDNDNNKNNKKKSLGSLSATCTNYLGNHRVIITDCCKMFFYCGSDLKNLTTVPQQSYLNYLSLAKSL